MKPEWRRFAPFGLYLSLLAAVAAVILYIVFKDFNLYIQISLGLFVIGLALFAILDPERVRLLLTGRQARHSSNALVLVLAFTGILVVINYLVYQNPKRWDLTEDRTNTLAPETLETLERLPQTVEAVAFYTTRVDSTQASSLLAQYEFNSNDQFEYRFVNPEEDPVAAQNAGITRDGTLLLAMGDRQELITPVTEAEVTEGLVRLMSDRLSVYFLTGHGEPSLQAGGQRSFSQAKAALEAKSYVVNELNLLTTNQIPQDAKVIVAGGANVPLSAEEVALLQGFVEGGGSLIVLSEPEFLTSFGEAEDPLAAFLQEAYGIALGEDLILDYSTNQLSLALAGSYADHPITQSFSTTVSYYPTARSVSSGEVEGYTSQELVATSPQSWAEKDLEALQSEAAPQPDEGTDLMGPVPVAVVSQDLSGKQRVAVFGDVDFATDQYFVEYANGDMLVNTIDWAAEQENLINLTQPQLTQRLIVPPTTQAQGLIQLVSIFLPPALVLLAGVVVFIQRRRRG